MSGPNILVFMTDHQRGDTVLSEHPCKTPNIDRLAAEGVTFTQTFCPSPHCCPARATFMSGLYPSRHGVWNNIANTKALSRGLNEGVRLWSEELAENGYRLAYSGKWHVDVDRGADAFGWDVRFNGCDKFRANDWDHWQRVAEQEKGRTPEERRPGEIVRPGFGSYQNYKTQDEHPMMRHDQNAVSAGIDALRDLADGDQPWALFIGCLQPHDPYFAPEAYVERYDLDQVPLPPHDPMDDKPAIYRRMRRSAWGQLSEQETRESIRHFWAMCSHLDDLFGQVMNALDATGQADNTLVVYCADHGDYAGEHGLFCKGIPAFRGAYHVPAVVRWPAGIKQPGRRVDDFVSLADFHPTFTDACLGHSDPDLTGRSLMPFLRNEPPTDWRDEIHTQCDGVELYFTQRSVTTRDWKYVFNGFDEDELYDLRNDPNELQNLALDPQYRTVVKDMCRRMWRFARQEQDATHVGYITTSIAPLGPASALQ